MTCLWSLPCNYRAGEEADSLVFNPKLFLPYTELKALVERSTEMTLLRSLFTLKETIIICSTGVLLVS